MNRLESPGFSRGEDVNPTMRWLTETGSSPWNVVPGRETDLYGRHGYS